MSTNLIATCIFLLVLFAWLANSYRDHRRMPLPPGPNADPIIGHARIIPPTKQALSFNRWAKRYGDVMHFKVFNQDMVVLGSFKTAQELLDTRGSIYSSRPDFPVFELMGWFPTLTLLPYGKRFLKHRKIFQDNFGRKEVLAYDHVFADEGRELVRNLSTARDPLHFVQRFTVSNIMRIAFGHKIVSDNDHFLQLAAEINYVFNNAGPPGGTPIDVFPWLRHFPSWFPGTHFASVARSHFKTVRKMYEEPLQYVKAHMKAGTMERCFTSEMLEKLGDADNSKELDDIKGAYATIFSAGSDTTYSTLTVFYLAMVLHPECQKQAYDEIIRVVGQDRLPVHSDRDSLPYLDSILQETLRWHPVLQLGFPHRSLEDDLYNDMFIPKDSTVVANVYGISRNEDVYSNPEMFNPSRFLPAPHGKDEPPFTSAFGFGRRKCPGQYFADIAIWYAMASTLATMEVVPAKNELGEDTIPEVAFTDGIFSKAVPFPFQLRMRSEAAQRLLSSIE